MGSSDAVTRNIARFSVIAVLFAVLVVALPSSAQGLGEDPVLSPTSDFEETDYGYVHQDFTPPDHPKAAIFTMDGYAGSSTPTPTHYIEMRDGALIAVEVDEEASVVDDGVWVQASIRGTGCSEGRFDLFDRVHAWDGHEIIEWAADQPWTLDELGMWGASYSGLTAWHVASTRPPSLAAMTTNMLFGDLYRGITYPGGVLNDIFPVAWTYGLRPALSASGAANSISMADEICAQNQARQETTFPMDEPIWAYARRTDDTWWHVRSPLSYAEQIEVPTYIGQAWQDEQTGPRGGAELFRAIDPDPVPVDPPSSSGEETGERVPKFLRTTNGYHNTAWEMAHDEAPKLFNRFLHGEDTGIMEEAPVKHHVDTTLANDGIDSEATFTQDAFPDPETTDWTRFYLDEGQTLSTTEPTGDAQPDAYVTGSPRKSWTTAGGSVAEPATTSDDPPDVLVYTSDPLETPQVIAGPMTAKLAIASTTTDFDVFVRVSDVGPDGDVTPLQRGMLKASHQGVFDAKTLYNEAGDVIRPYHAHTDPDPVTAGAVNEYLVEIFPLVHVLPPDHSLRVEIGTPPLTDGLWGYDPVRQSGVNFVHHSAEYPSSILVPFADWAGEDPIPEATPCGAPIGYRCLSSS